MDKIYIVLFMQCAPYEYFQSICDLKAELCMESLCAQLLGAWHACIGYPKVEAKWNPASCPLAAGQARVLAGWPRARIQSVSEFWIMHA